MYFFPSLQMNKCNRRAHFEERGIMKRAIVMSVCLLWLGIGVVGTQTVSAASKDADDSPRLKIAWFTTMSKDEKTGRLKLMHTDFWPTTKMFAVAASEDLGIDLDIHYADGNFVLLLQQVEETISNEETRPDGMIFHNWKGKGEEMLHIAEKYGVESFAFNAGFPENSPVGKPREKYKHWIGLMHPDDEHAGYLLGRSLIEAAGKLPDRKNNDAIEMVALEGNRMSEASNLRTKGLKRALSEHPDVKLHQYFHTKWSRKLGGNAFSMTRQRFPETTVFWAASESMAIGVIEEAAGVGWVPGTDFVTGGIDLLPCNFHYLQSRKMSVSIGGHYLEGAWALILLHDYLKGRDFAENQSVTFKTRMIAVSEKNIDDFADFAERITPENVARIDFKKYSKVYNPAITDYRFPTGEVLKQLGR